MSLICREECKFRSSTLRGFLPFDVTSLYFKFVVSHQVPVLKNPQCLITLSHSVTGEAVVCTALGYRKQQFIGVIQSRRLRPKRSRSYRSNVCKITAPYAFIITARMSVLVGTVWIIINRSLEWYSWFF
jgi:hypothetical protein